MLSIPHPCHEDWEQMTPCEKGRFCALCQKIVVNFEDKSNEEVLALISQNAKKKLCVKTTNQQLHQVNHLLWNRHLKKAGFLALVLVLTNCEAQTTPPQTPQETVRSTSIDDCSLRAIPSPIDVLNLLDSLDKPRKQGQIAALNAIPTELPKDISRLPLLYGFYATDLLYAYFYRQNKLAQQYHTLIEPAEQLMGIKNSTYLANNQQVRDLLQKKSSMKNIGDLLNIAQENLNSGAEFCRENKQKQDDILPYLIASSGWLESLYLSTLHYEITKHKGLRNKIGGQKIALEHFNPYLSIQQNNPLFAEWMADFKTLEKAYQPISLRDISNPPTTVKVDDHWEVISNDYTEITASEQDFANLLATIKAIREKYRVK